MEITITKAEAESFVNLIEDSFFDIIRADETIDNVAWASNLLSLYTKIKTEAKL